MARVNTVRRRKKEEERRKKEGCISILNKAKNLSLLGNRQQATGNREYTGK
ncbi:MULTISPECIES: hypothetical protein [Okeania]|uniref:hypothetical protein n=1 Tax=Okeania TaxID=1458928 RepID=UPI001374B23E|nr:MULTISPECIES: hypothetical protein [Okeania]NET14512.1 hypothetical protein [Okeania sp. SIO1H6]NET19258.1 hypothetical protein [Okeania sp. SIO1H5]NES93459.1 hypothetical protein [Okeania sp. SIO2B9]NET74887.1 hypothetical protein [Okeania sp. SIO1F9]NET93469.1 hypothetical protein [Okeania sp. SIO1H2]